MYSGEIEINPGNAFDLMKAAQQLEFDNVCNEVALFIRQRYQSLISMSD